MLQFIRDKAQGWFAWIVVGIICFVFAFWGIRTYLYSNQMSTVIAKVNGAKITQQEFSRVYNLLRRQQQIQLGANYVASKENTARLKEAALQSMITSITLNSDAYSLGFRVSPNLVEATIAEMPIFQVDGVFSEARFEQVLQATMMTVDQFYDEVQNDILINQVRGGMLDSTFALPSEVEQLVQLLNQKREFDYAVISANTLMPEVKISEKALREYYDAHQKDFEIPAKIKVNYIQLSMDELKKSLHPNAKTLQEFYENNQASFTEPAEWKLATLLVAVPVKGSDKEWNAAKQKIDEAAKAIRAGESFEAAVQKYSDDQSFITKKKALPWLNGARLGEAERNILPQLKHEGDISTPVKTERGYEIIKVVGIKAAQAKPFEKVKKQVSDIYFQRTVEQNFANLSDQLANLTYESPNSLEPAASKLNLKIQTSPFFTRQSEKSGLFHQPKIVAAAFSNEVIQGNNSDAIVLSDNSVVVLRVKEYQGEKTRPFADVRSEVLKILSIKESQQKAKLKGEKIIAELNQGKSLTELKASNSISWTHVPYVTRQDKKIYSGALITAFDANVPASKGQRVNYGQSLGNGDYVIVSVTGVELGDFKELKKQEIDSFTTGLEKNYGMLEYNLYVSGLIKEATVKQYEASEATNGDDSL